MSDLMDDPIGYAKSWAKAIDGTMGQHCLESLLTLNAELEAELEKLRKALDKYGVHSPYCVSHIHKKCDCGLREALLQENNDE